MKKTLILVFVLALAACSKKSPATSTTTPEPAPAATGDGAPCAQEIMLTCPEGQVDGCTKTPVEGDTHKCVAK